MEHIAQQVKNSNSLTNVQSIPRQIINSMDVQGMANMNAFSPGTPINPTNPIGTEPRQYEYMIGQNIVQRPRSTELVGFDAMRSIVEMYDVAQMAIEVRQDELRNLDWDIIPQDEKDAKKYESEIKTVRKFFEKPDSHILFDDFQNQLAYDWLAFDALTIFPHLTKGGKLGALECVDGTTVTPLIDYYGRIPESPAPAYIQWMYGMPWVWLDRDNLIYRPHRKRTNKLYGFSPVEWLLNTINTDIRYQLYFLQYFTDGSIPDTWINAPDEMRSPEHIKQFQEMYDTVMIGDQTQKHKVKFIPFGSKVQQAKDTKFDIDFPQFMLQKACAAFKVTPAELGFTEKVNKSSGESQENVQFRRSIKPSAMFFANIYTGIIQKYFNLPNLRFKYLNVDEQEDLLLMAQRDEIYIKNGVISPDEVRIERLGLDVNPKNTVPRVFMLGSTIIPVTEAINAKVDTGQSESVPEDNADNKTKEIEPNIKEHEEAKKAMLDFFISPMKV